MNPCICRASARPPAFLPTTPHFPSSLEGMWSCKAPNGNRLLNGANGLGQNPYSSRGFGLSQSEAFPPSSPERSDVARERDVILHIKGECMHALGALLSGPWLLALGLCLGDQVLGSWQESRTFPQGFSCRFNGKNAFTPYYLLSLFRSQ